MNIRACGAHSRTSNTDTKLLIYSLFQKGRVLAQDGSGKVASRLSLRPLPPAPTCRPLLHNTQVR